MQAFLQKHVIITSMLFLLILAFITGYVFDFSLYGSVSTVLGLDFIFAIILYWFLFCIAAVNRYFFWIFTIVWFLFLSVIHSVLEKEGAKEKVFSVLEAIEAVFKNGYDVFKSEYFLTALPFVVVGFFVGFAYYILLRILDALEDKKDF